MKQNGNKRGWMAPGWSWGKELTEVAKCLMVTVLILAVLAIPAKWVYDTYFNQPVNDPRLSSAYNGNASVGGGANVEDVFISKNSSKDPSASGTHHTGENSRMNSEDGSGVKDPSYDSMSPVKEPEKTDYYDSADSGNTPVTRETSARTSILTTSNDAPEKELADNGATFSASYLYGGDGRGENVNDLEAHEPGNDDGSSYTDPAKPEPPKSSAAY